MKIPHRRLTQDDRKRIVFRRFGSLDDFSVVILSLPKISKQMRIPCSTVNYVTLKFCRGGHTFDVFETPSRRFRKLTIECKGFLLSPRTLEKWAPFNLKERVEAIRRLFEIDVSTYLLRSFYKENGIRYVGAKVMFRQAIQAAP